MSVNRLGVRDLVLDGVGHTYRSGRAEPVVTLEPTDLTIDAGEFVALIDPSGSASSTLLEIIAGLRSPSHGEVRLGGAKVSGPGRLSGVTFLHSSSLLPWRTVAENVELGLLRSGLPKGEHALRVRRELDRAELTAFAQHAVHELSADVQLRVQFARSLVTEPDVLLLDEPLGALDAISRERWRESLRAIWKATGKTIVLATRSVDEAVLLGTRVIVLGPRPGHVVSDHHISFSRRDESFRALRSDPGFHRFASRIRSSIGQLQDLDPHVVVA